ncbi:AKT-interacting protein-like [Sycon ciliatum]|uniref:AKT-interacting protein-like n=1 Tax=Sycon ciliatum TaxID=27933 RepID=UPI0020A98355|eukprot:scpid22509/ scgid19308/ AKT-interacting protein; Fused toes protein homolog
MSRAMAQHEDGQSSAGMHTFRPFLQEYSLMSELRNVQRRRIPGLYVIPSATSSLVWFGLLVVRSGCYTGGVFKFVLIADDGHPHSGAVPFVIFQPPVFHPLVDMVTGQMNCGVSFRKWKAQSNTLAELLEFVKDAFYQVTTLEAVNPEASSIYTNNKDNFKQRAMESVQYCRSRLFDSLATVGRSSSGGDIDEDVDVHAFPVSLIDGALLEEAKAKMIASSEPAAASGSDDSARASPSDGNASETSSVATFTGDECEEVRRSVPTRGLSWVKQGSATPFSADSADS